MEVSDLPFVNASLNALSGSLLLAGYVCIRRGQKTAHARLMIAAFSVSTIFLGCYLTYHYLAGHKPYEGEGLFRTIYFLVLISHIILAVLVVPMVLRTIYLAWKQRWRRAMETMMRHLCELRPLTQATITALKSPTQ